MRFFLRLLASACLACVPIHSQISGTTRGPSEVAINTPFVTTPPEVARAMLKLARVGKDDVVYDLGSGDGRIVIMAAREFGARGVGIEISPEHISEARESAKKTGVAARVEFRQQDLFDADIHDATVVAIYLLPEVNLRLRPKLMRELKPGTRVVSHTFNMGNWKPEQNIRVSGTPVLLWTVPARPLQ